MRFEGKSALVTGGAGGIGVVLAASLRAEGARVAVSDRDSSGVEADAHLDGDLLDGAFCDALPGQAEAALGGLDMVFNNAGVITRGDITETSDADWSLTMGVNVEAPFRICRAAVPILTARGGGAIVNTSSCWGLRPGANHPLYVMSKAAVASLTQCLGRDHAHQGIRVNAVCPNEVDTPMLRTGFAIRGWTRRRRLTSSMPASRWAISPARRRSSM
ncbi:SDR family NAD(P)-dependent oxidoreductase [Roseovarius rhodophyticola]|uniref:SDR family oxidoreductase n=1 Tax=Roseovarius rhodophyticola TaxID=3080827 RepID=A0ABZ2TIP9_9RHOB